jgi:hypothetical protein
MSQGPSGKEVIRPAMPRPSGDYHCPLCNARYDQAGVCTKDDIPLRRRLTI